MKKPLNSITVLYVDDEPINLELFKLSFRNQFNVITARSGMEGLEILKTIQGVDAVISDMKMPQLSGLEFIKQANRKYNSIVYFILSGYYISDEIEKEMENGVIKK